MRLAILADDFTGACDAAAAFAASESTFVALGSELSDADVVAIDLDLRERDDGEAQATTHAVARRLGAQRVFLKIDSTLRGPIAGLVAGALSGADKEIAMIAPAFPEHGRLLHEGCLLMDGRRGPSLHDILGMQRTALLGANFARSSHEVVHAVEHAAMRGMQRVVVDTDASEGLTSVAQAWRSHPEWLVVGSAGLARQVAGVPSISAAPPIALRDGPLLIVAGSPAAATRAQLEQLSRSGADITVMSTPPATERDAGEAAQLVADAVATWSQKHLPRAVVLVGGATARAVCQRFNASGVRLIGELSPGIPCGSLVGGFWDAMPVVTKAGGFGSPDTLLDVAYALGVRSSPDG